MSKRTAVLVGLLIGIAPLVSQQTFIVDINGGGDFTQIQPAVDAASAGDIIRVRHGEYEPVSISKGIRLLGDPRGPNLPQVARIRGLLDISDLPLQETLILTELLPYGVSIKDCQGDLYLSRVVSYDALLIDSADYVSMHRCYFSASLYSWANSSTSAIIRSSRVFDTRSFINSSYGIGLSASDSKLVLVQTSVSGGGTSKWGGNTGAVISSCEIDYTAGTSVRAGTGMYGWYPGAPQDFYLYGVNRVSRAPHSLVIDEVEEVDSLSMVFRSGYLEPHVAVAMSLATRPVRTPDGGYHLDPSSLQILFDGVSKLGSARSKPITLPAFLSPNIHHRDRNFFPHAPAGSQWLGIPVTFQAMVTDQQGQRLLSLPYTIVF